MWKVLKEIQHCLWTTKPPRLATPFLEGGMVVLEPSSDGMIPGRLVYEVAKSTFSLSAEDWSHGPKEQQREVKLSEDMPNMDRRIRVGASSITS
jgi:hypothetical protein